jgi:hypothetical protein
MAELSHAVFLSYASQDAEAARRIAGALRQGGIEVWLDQSELRGGDSWDASIRRQIRACALFVPIISRYTHTRDEGYFRLEWKLATIPLPRTGEMTPPDFWKPMERPLHCKAFRAKRVFDCPFGTSIRRSQ